MTTKTKPTFTELSQLLDPYWARLHSMEDSGENFFDRIFAVIEANGWTRDEYYSQFWMQELTLKEKK